jgi:predicted MFS family arabinose efflux permease
VLILVMALPSAWLWIPAQPAAAPLSTPRAGASWLRLLRNPKVVLLCVAAALNYAPVVALMTQMMPLALSKGLPSGMAVGAVSTIGLAAFGGALVSGLLVDRFWAPAVACALNLAPAIGCLFLLSDAVSPLVFYGAVIMIGLGQGAEIDIVAFMIGRYFGLKDYATIYGLGVLCIGFSVAIAAAAIGRAYDWFGNYDIALIGASASFGLAAVAYLALGRYPDQD